MERLSQRGIFYGWAILAALCIAEPVSWGIQYYTFAVMQGPMGEELGWSRSQLTGAFSLALLVSGIAAVPIGRHLDRRGARWVMALGSVGAAAMILLWSQVTLLPVYYLTWIGLGITMAATLYEPAFVAIANWFSRYRARAMMFISLGGGFASVIFVPLAEWLVNGHGWRNALVILAGLLLAITLPLHALVLRRRPEDYGLEPDGAPAPATTAQGPARPAIDRTVREAIRGVPFWAIAVAWCLTMMVNVAFVFMMIPALTEVGFTSRFAAFATGAIGISALPGRVIFAPLGERVPRQFLAAIIFATQAVALVLIAGATSEAMVLGCIALFGAGMGAISPVRAALTADLYGRTSFGTISGLLTLLITVVRATGPIGSSLVRDQLGSYHGVWLILALCSLVAAAVALLARPPAPRPEPASFG